MKYLYKYVAYCRSVGCMVFLTKPNRLLLHMSIVVYLLPLCTHTISQSSYSARNIRLSHYCIVYMRARYSNVSNRECLVGSMIYSSRVFVDPGQWLQETTPSNITYLCLAPLGLGLLSSNEAQLICGPYITVHIWTFPHSLVATNCRSSHKHKDAVEQIRALSTITPTSFLPMANWIWIILSFGYFGRAYSFWDADLSFTMRGIL